jgi:PD-(D/E)XK nuclease superfamily
VSDSAAVKPLRLSWSRLRLHDECPAKGELTRANKSPLTDIRNYFPGSVVDLAMRRWLDQEVPAPGWMAASIDDILDESRKIAKDTKDGIVRWRGADDEAEVRAFCRELVTRLEPILARYALPFEWEPAKRFAVPVTIPYLDGTPTVITLVGETDLVVRDCKGRIVVWDLKATKDNNYYKKVLGQLTFYALVVRLMTGTFPVMTGLIQPMCEQQVLPVTVDMQAVREMAGRITRTAHDIWAGRLAPKEDDAGCSWCEVASVCPKFAPRLTPGRVTLARA